MHHLWLSGSTRRPPPSARSAGHISVGWSIRPAERSTDRRRIGTPGSIHPVRRRLPSERDNRTHRGRRAVLRASLAHSGLDALLVTDLINVRYLTGFTGSNAALLVLAPMTSPATADDHRQPTAGSDAPHPVLHRRPLHHPIGARGAGPAPADRPALRPGAAAPGTGGRDRVRGAGRSASPTTWAC